MSRKLFVGGLSWNTTDEGLRGAFSRFGAVIEAKVVTDRETGRSRGFGFVTFQNPADGEAARQAMDGASLDTRAIRVSPAEDKPRGPRPGFERGPAERDAGPRGGYEPRGPREPVSERPRSEPAGRSFEPRGGVGRPSGGPSAYGGGPPAYGGGDRSEGRGGRGRERERERFAGDGPRPKERRGRRRHEDSDDGDMDLDY